MVQSVATAAFRRLMLLNCLMLSHAERNCESAAKMDVLLISTGRQARER